MKTSRDISPTTRQDPSHTYSSTRWAAYIGVSLGCDIMLNFTSQDLHIAWHILVYHVWDEKSTVTSVRPSPHTRPSLSFMTALFFHHLSFIAHSKSRHVDRKDSSITILMMKQAIAIDKLNSSCNRLYSPTAVTQQGGGVSPRDREIEGNTTPPSSLTIANLARKPSHHHQWRHPACKSDVDRHCISPFGTSFSASSHRRLPIWLSISTSPSANCNPFSASGNLRRCTSTSNVLESQSELARPCVFVPCFFFFCLFFSLFFLILFLFSFALQTANVHTPPPLCTVSDDSQGDKHDQSFSLYFLVWSCRTAWFTVP